MPRYYIYIGPFEKAGSMTDLQWVSIAYAKLACNERSKIFTAYYGELMRDHFLLRLHSDRSANTEDEKLGLLDDAIQHLKAHLEEKEPSQGHSEYALPSFEESDQDAEQICKPNEEFIMRSHQRPDHRKLDSRAK